MSPMMEGFLLTMSGAILGFLFKSLFEWLKSKGHTCCKYHDRTVESLIKAVSDISHMYETNKNFMEDVRQEMKSLRIDLISLKEEQIKQGVRIDG